MELKQIKGTRTERWADFIRRHSIETVLEIGVYRGKLAEYLLENCPGIKKYFMLDPWKNMEEWNSLYNFTENMEDCLKETLERTDFAKTKRVILRGKTTEVIDEVEDDSIGFTYIDGDHSLRGIVIDLIKVFPKIKSDGYIAGHDFRKMVWRENPKFEPWLVFPYAVYFAEAMDVKIYALPSGEFIINKGEKGYEFIDLTKGKYSDTSILYQVLNIPKSYTLPIIKNFWRRFIN